MIAPPSNPIEMKDRASMRGISNQLGNYFAREPIAPVEMVQVHPVMLNPRCFPPCKHCGGNVHCENYDPDMTAGLWGETA